MQDRVDLGGPPDAIKDRVVGIRLDELGAFEGKTGLFGIEPHDHLDFGQLFQLLCEMASPKGAEPSDENAHAHPYPNHTLRRVRNMS